MPFYCVHSPLLYIVQQSTELRLAMNAILPVVRPPHALKKTCQLSLQCKNSGCSIVMRFILRSLCLLGHHLFGHHL